MYTYKLQSGNVIVFDYLKLSLDKPFVPVRFRREGVFTDRGKRYFYNGGVLFDFVRESFN